MKLFLQSKGILLLQTKHALRVSWFSGFPHVPKRNEARLFVFGEESNKVVPVRWACIHCMHTLTQ